MSLPPSPFSPAAAVIGALGVCKMFGFFCLWKDRHGS